MKSKRQRKHSKKSQTKKNTSKLRCSPKEKGEMNTFSCYTNKSLNKLKALWNARHPDHLITTNRPQEIHAKLTSYMSGVCNKESCWLKQQKVFGKSLHKDADLVDSFAPVSPKSWEKNPNEWLSSLDIINVMKQYEKAYKCFDFIGPSPMDFDTKKLFGKCVWEELCKFSLSQQLKQKKTKIGVIFNTDPHTEGGEHWLSLFINIKKGEIFFFDSVGEPPAPEVRAFVDRVMKQGKELNPPIHFKFDSNEGIEHQYGNTECGIYSIFFIVHMLEDKITDYYLKNHILKDKYMEQFRDIYFNDSL